MPEATTDTDCTVTVTLTEMDIAGITAALRDREYLLRDSPRIVAKYASVRERLDDALTEARASR